LVVDKALKVIRKKLNELFRLAAVHPMLLAVSYFMSPSLR